MIDNDRTADRLGVGKGGSRGSKHTEQFVNRSGSLLRLAAGSWLASRCSLVTGVGVIHAAARQQR